MLTIEPGAPRPRRWLTSRCMRKNGARALTAKSLSQSRRSASASDPRSVRAAELAKASTWPKRMSAASKISSGASGSSRSAATNKPAAPHRSTSATAAAPLAASLPVTTTAWAPALAAARAMAKPMPWVEPVTTTTRPFTLSPPLGRSYYPYAISDQRFRLSNSGTLEARRTHCDLAIPSPTSGLWQTKLFYTSTHRGVGTGHRIRVKFVLPGWGGEDFGEPVYVPARDFSLELDAFGSGRLGWPPAGFDGKVGRVAEWRRGSELVEGKLAHQRHVLRAVALAHTRQVLLEGHVERPVQRVLDSPVAADVLCEPGHGTSAGCDVIANVEPGAILQLGPRFDPDDRARVGEADFAGKAPVAVEPIDLPQHRDGAGFDAAVALVDIDVDINLALADGFEGSLDIGLEGRLIAFNGEQIVGSGVADGLGDLRIAGDGVDGDHGAFEAAAGGEFLEQQRDRGRFVGFVV